MTDHRVRVIRFWFAAFYAFALLWFFPHQLSILALIPLALFMPVIASTAACTFCQTGTLDEVSVSVTVSGVTNNGCTDCANWDNTYSVPWSVGFPGVDNPCIYFSFPNSFKLCGGLSNCTFCSITAAWQSDGSMLARLHDTVAATDAVAGAVAVPRDCSTSPLTGVSFGSDSSRCIYTTATATVVI